MDSIRPNGSPMLPPIFVSHGSPMTALEPGAAGAFMQALGPVIDRQFGRPKAILAISAHSLTREPVLLSGHPHEAVYDFGGFDPALYQIRYDAPGAPALAERVHGLLQARGLPVHSVAETGLDHGIWTPLKYLYPEANIPVLPLAWVPSWTPAQQWALGEALAPLAEDGVLILGSGSITHNLRLWAQGRPQLDTPEYTPSREFREWFARESAARHWDALLNYREQAPHAVAMHPTDEHLLPWYVAAGAGGTSSAPVRVHQSAAYSFIGMDAYAFGPAAASLGQALGSSAVQA